MRALEQTFHTLNFHAISQTVALILGARTINLFGFGGSGTSANEAKNKFMKILPNCIYNSDTHIQLTQAALLSPEDVAIIFCNSGITKDCIEIAHICHTAKVPVVFISLHNLQNTRGAIIRISCFCAVQMRDLWRAVLSPIKPPSFS